MNLRRYLVDVKWMRQWKKYVGYDKWEQKYAGLEAAHPGPVYNQTMFKGKKYNNIIIATFLAVRLCLC